jgi:hypothetical protein
VRLPRSAHTSQPWRIHEIAHDFRVEDVWALPTPGGPDDFPRLVRLIGAFDPSRSSSYLVRALFAVRERLGDAFGWDDPARGLGERVEPLRKRLPAELRETGGRLDFEAVPFTPLYVTHDELAAEIANQTVHGVIHVGWVGDGPNTYRGQLAILVKPNGLLGSAYLAAIKPFRYLIVYPRAIRGIERAWETAHAV